MVSMVNDIRPTTEMDTIRLMAQIVTTIEMTGNLTITAGAITTGTATGLEAGFKSVPIWAYTGIDRVDVRRKWLQLTVYRH